MLYSDKVAQGQNRRDLITQTKWAIDYVLFTDDYIQPCYMFFRSILVRLQIKLIDNLICIDVFWYNKALLLCRT